jgi:hypothetical protein
MPDLPNEIDMSGGRAITVCSLVFTSLNSSGTREKDEEVILEKLCGIYSGRCPPIYSFRSDARRYIS